MKLLIGQLQPLKQKLPDDKKPLVEMLIKDVVASLQVNTVQPHHLYPEYKIVPPFNSAVVDWTKNNWTPNKNDVMVVSFPKTGTTWTREIVRRILYKDSPASYQISKGCEIPFLGYLEAGSETKYKVVDALNLERTVWGTHLVTDLLNMDTILNSGAKLIYVMRNPKDMVISYKRFVLGMPTMKHPGIKRFFPDSLEDFVKNFVEGKVPMFMKEGEWYPHHIRSWMKYKDHPNVHFVFYEDMKQNPSAEIRKISKHINAPLTEAELEEVVEKTSFNSMKKKAGSAMEAANMFRKGGVGGWKDHLSEELSQLIESKMKKDLGDVNIDFTYSLEKLTAF